MTRDNPDKSVTGYCFARNLVWFTNCITFFTGAALIAAGIFSLVELDKYLPLTTTNIAYLGAFLIVTGTILFLMGFLGCCGSMKEDVCMLQWFFNIIFILVIVEIAAAALGYVYRDTISNTLVSQWNAGVTSNSTTVLNTIDLVQTTFSCCGLNNYTYWNSVTTYNYDQPPSCCQRSFYQAEGYPDCIDPPSNLYQEGCTTAFGSWISRNLIIVASVATVFILMQILGMWFACCMIKNIRERQYNEYTRNKKGMEMKQRGV